MDCPECGAETSVVETAPYPDRVRRRRECEACDHRFTTKEEALLSDDALAGLLGDRLNRAVDALMKSRGLAGSLGLPGAPEDLDEALLKVREVRDRLEQRGREAEDAG